VQPQNRLVLLGRPRALFERWVQVVTPAFAALFAGTPREHGRDTCPVLAAVLADELDELLILASAPWPFNIFRVGDLLEAVGALHRGAVIKVLRNLTPLARLELRRRRLARTALCCLRAHLGSHEAPQELILLSRPRPRRFVGLGLTHGGRGLLCIRGRHVGRLAPGREQLLEDGCSLRIVHRSHVGGRVCEKVHQRAHGCGGEV